MLSAGPQRGFEAYITHQNGTRYAEHEVEDSPLSTMCYLQSQEGKMYRIHLRATDLVKRLNPKRDWVVAYRVDSRLIHQVAVRKGTFHEVCSEMHSEENEEIYRGHLTFSKISTTDDALEVTLDEEVKAGLGEIRIDIYDGRYGLEVPWMEPVLAKADVGVAQETDVKRIGCTSASSKTPWVFEPHSKEVNFHYNDPSAPFYSFVFLHRTKTALEILGVIKFDRDAQEEEDLADKIQKKRKRTKTPVDSDIIVLVDLDSEEEGDDERSGSNDSEEVRQMRKRVAELERRLRISETRNRPSRADPADAVDLTGGDSEEEDEDDKE